MTSRAALTILIAILTTSPPVLAADNANTQVKETGREASSTAASPLSVTDLVRARSWGLSETEWQRYRQLLQGIRGSISPATISPLEVLGIHARDAAERQRYAEAWAHAMHEDTDRILAFQRDYDAAMKRLYPNEPLIDIGRLSGKADKAEAIPVFQATDRLLFFTRPECPPCDTLMDRLLKRLDDVSGMDIYITGIESGDDAAVRTWASAHRIDADRVRSRRITLNHDGGALDKLTGGQHDVPYVLRRRGEDLSQLRLSDL